MKICFVINECDFFYSHRFDLAKKLLSIAEVIVLTDYTNTDKKIIKEINSAGIMLHMIKKRASQKGLSGFIRYFFRLKKAIKLIKPSSIFFVTLEISLLGILVSKFSKKINYFYLVTGFGPFFFKQNLKNKFLYLVYKCIFMLANFKKNSKFIFQNIEDMDIFINRGFSSKINSILIHGSGINIKQMRFHQRSESEPVSFLFASRLVNAKGLNEFFLASESLKKDYPEISINIVGKYDVNDPDRISDELFSKIKNVSHINYLGEIDFDAMKDFLSKYTVFVLPSHGEGLPKSAIEAAASGMPLILSSASGCKECIINRKNGLLVETKNVNSLKDAMEWMILNKKTVPKMSIASRSLIEDKFCLEKIYLEYENIIINRKQV